MAYQSVTPTLCRRAPAAARCLSAWPVVVDGMPALPAEPSRALYVRFVPDGKAR
jgi:hypothetical protein